MYVDYYKNFRIFSNWFLDAEDIKELNTLRPTEYADLCMNCGKDWGNTVCGRLRLTCPECYKNMDLTFHERILKYYNEAMIEQILNLNFSNSLPGYMAEGLKLTLEERKDRARS